MELLFWIDAFKRASAQSVTAVVPYFSYAKGDKKDEPRVSVRARVCADAIEAAGADRMVTIVIANARANSMRRALTLPSPPRPRRGRGDQTGGHLFRDGRSGRRVRRGPGETAVN